MGIWFGRSPSHVVYCDTLRHELVRNTSYEYVSHAMAIARYDDATMTLYAHHNIHRTLCYTYAT